jgi:undecaprenyl-diphosphatase
LFCGVTISGVSAWLCIHYFLKLLDHSGMLMFVLYRLVLGVILLVIFL